MHDPHAPTPTQPFERRRRATPTRSSWRPTTPPSCAATSLRAIARARQARTASSSTPGTPSERSQVFAYAAEVAALTAARAMSRVLVTGGAGTIGAAVVRRLLRDAGYEVRVSDQREAPQWMREGCEVHTGDLRELDEARAATARLLARHPPRGDRRRDRQLPQAPAHADRGQQRALQRDRPRRARPRRRALRLRVHLDGVRARDRVPDDRGAPRRLPDAAVGVRLLEADRRGLLPRRARRARPAVHDLPAVQRLRARARCPSTSRASRTWSPT